MIIEDFVSFETAKLLKEKGFNEITSKWYLNYKGEYRLVSRGSAAHDNDSIDVPTLQMTMKWLREVYNILLVADYEWECDTTPYFFKIYRLGENRKPERIAVKGVSYDKNNNPTEHIVGYRDWERGYGNYSTYEQACEAAIKYCLENLI